MARAANAVKSLGTGESKSGRSVKSAARSDSDRARNSSAKDGTMVNITGLLYSGFRSWIYRAFLRGEISMATPAMRPAIGPKNFLIFRAFRKS